PADPRAVLRHTLDEHAVAEVRRIEVRADVGLDADVVELAVVLREPARYRLRVAHDRAAHEVAVRGGARRLLARLHRSRLGRRCLRGDAARNAQQRNGRYQTGAAVLEWTRGRHSALKKATRSCFSCSLYWMLKRRS